MALALLPAFLSLAASGGQDSAALVDGMIERSNALKSFVAEYRASGSQTDPGDPEAILRIAYRAPEDLAVEVIRGSDRFRCVISSGTMSVLTPGEDGGSASYGFAEQESSTAQARPRITRAFEEQFPGLDGVGGSPGLDVFVIFRAKPGTDAERPSFTCQGGTGRGEGPLLGWLGHLKRSNAVLTEDGDALVWDAGEGIRITLQKDTGFIGRIEVTYRGETKTGLELRTLSTDTDIDDAEFRQPTPDPSAKDISEHIRATVAATRLMAMRALIERRIRDGVEADTLDWNDDVRARLGRVLRVVHVELAPLLSVDTVSWARSAIDQLCFWYQESKRALPEGDVARARAVEDAVVEWDARFRESLEKKIEPYLVIGVPERESTKAAAITAELRSLELEAAEAACRESVVEASLKYLSEQMERARRGELPPAKD